MPEPRRWKLWVCSHCGYAPGNYAPGNYAPGNHRSWCNAGCGSDYNKMVEVEVVEARPGEPSEEAVEAGEQVLAGAFNPEGHEPYIGTEEARRGWIRSILRAAYAVDAVSSGHGFPMHDDFPDWLVDVVTPYLLPAERHDGEGGIFDVPDTASAKGLLYAIREALADPEFDAVSGKEG